MRHVENLEERQYFALGSGVITINLGNGDDNIMVTQAAGVISLRNSGGVEIDKSSGTVTGLIINLNGGHDTVRLFNFFTGAEHVLFGVAIYGGDGNDFIHGGKGADTLRGQNGNDGILGGDGSDRLIGGLGNDYLDGQAGSDTADYSNNVFSVAVSLDNSINDGVIGDISDRDEIYNFENIMGGSGHDILVGNSGANAIDGGGGNDKIGGRGGNDTLTGGIGNDTLWGEDGADSLFAKDGNSDGISDGPGTDSAQIDNPGDTATNATPVSVAVSALMVQFAKGGFESLALFSVASPGEFDGSFGSEGVAFHDPGFNYEITDTIMQGDKILLVGSNSNQSGNRDFWLMRLNEDGGLDTTFGADDGEGGRTGLTFTDFTLDEFQPADDYASAVTIDDLGRIVVAGWTSANFDDNDYALARYDSSGVLDTSFGTGGLVIRDESGIDEDVLYDVVAVRTDDVLTYYAQGLTESQFAQLVMFDENGNWAGNGNSMIYAPLGDPLVVPIGLAVVHDPEADVARILFVLDANGGASSRATIHAFTLEGTLMSGGGVVGYNSGYEFYARDFDLRGDRIVVTGTAYDGENASRGGVGAATLNFDDGLYLTDSVFTTVAEDGRDIEFNDVAFDADNRAVAVGFDDANGETLTYRFSTDDLAGDPTFEQDAVASFNVGLFSEQTPGLIVTRLYTTSSASNVVVQDDGKIVVAGYASDSFTESTYAAFMRFNGGTLEPNVGPPELDTTFNPFGNPPGTADFPFIGTIRINDTESAQVYDFSSEGYQNKTYLAGRIWNGESDDAFVMRLNEDGSLDDEYGEGAGWVMVDTTFYGSLDDEILDIEVQVDGSLTFVGKSHFGEGLNDSLFGRLLSDGSLDTFIGSGLGYLVNDYSNGGSDEAVGVVVHTDVEGFPTGYSVAVNYFNETSGNRSVGLAKLNTQGFGGVVSTVDAGGDDIDAVEMVQAPNGDLLVLANYEDVGSEGDVESAAIYRFDGVTGAAINTTDIVLTGPITSWYAEDLAIDAGGNAHVVGSGFDGFSESPSFGVVVYLQEDAGTLTANDSLFVTQPSDVYFDSVEIDENGAAIVGGQSNGQLAVFRTEAASARPDTSYSDDGLVETPIGQYDNFSGGIAIQADGKYVIGGSTWAGGGDTAIAARFLPGEIAEDIIEDDELPDVIPSLVWYNDEGEIAGPLGHYFIYRILNPNLNEAGELSLFGAEVPPTTPSGFAALAVEEVLNGDVTNDEFVIGRRWTVPDENGISTEYFYVEVNGDGQAFNLADLTKITINGGKGKTTVILENAIGIPINIIAEEDNLELIVKTTPDGDPASGSDREMSAFAKSAGLNSQAFDNSTPATGDDTVVVTPVANFNGDASVSYTIKNSAASSTDQFVEIELTAVNDAPTGSNKTLTNGTEDTAKTITAVTLVAGASGPANEPGETYKIGTVSGAVGGAVVLNASGNVVFTPTANYNGPASFKFTIVDNGQSNGQDDPQTSVEYTASFNINAVNDAPTAITPGTLSIQENKPVGTQVGVFSTADIDNTNAQMTYSLVSGTGSTDNAQFQVSPGGILTSKTTFNYEAKNSYTVRVRATDPGGLSTEKIVVISVLDVAESLTKFTGTVIGTNPSGSNNSREKAFDGKLSTYFKGAASLPSSSWAGLDMKTPQTVAQIKFAPPSFGGQVMVGGKFQASNTADFSSGVVTIYTITTAPPANQLTTVNVNMTGAYRYFRYFGPANSYGQVAEVEFYGFTDQQAPSKPGKPTVTARNLTSIGLAWAGSTDNVAVARYDIYRNGVKVGTSATPTFTATGLKPGTWYEFKVLAVDTNGNVSAFSDSLSANTLADTVIPSKPTNVRKGTVTRSSIQLLWNASTDNVAVSHYIIYRDGKQVGTSTSLSFNNTGLSANRNYTFTVRAVDTSGNLSLLSDQVIIKTLA